jgi:hypothetical protein
LAKAVFELLDTHDRFGLGHRRVLGKSLRGRDQHRCARHRSQSEKHRCLTGIWRFPHHWNRDDIWRLSTPKM